MKRQWKLIAKVDGGNEQVNAQNFLDLKARTAYKAIKEAQEAQRKRKRTFSTAVRELAMA